ncbi:50S ribosomal protein L1 [Candidatus Saccharibacteria bacterium]|nr:MAG: 50S ribosomal protein L1 [Candidatus Saccharibacteria bacterium]
MAEPKDTQPIAETDAVEATENTAAEAPVVDEVAAKPTAKAGKRSAKGLQEAEAKAEKIEHQKHREEEQAAEEAKPKQPVKPTRTRLERRAKGYRKAAEEIDRAKTYSLQEALALAAKTSRVKFDASVELHVRLGVDPRQADQNLRDTIVLPAGTGKTTRVAVFADVDDAAKAKEAGADIAAGDEFLQQLEKGTLDFDVLIATPAMMPKLGKYARTLGPKGLMPNPKSGTVTTDVAKAVAEAKAGRVEYRVDSTGIVHIGIGKVSFDTEKLLENARAVLKSLKANKPASIKGTYVKSMFATTTMGPSVRIDSNEL